MDFGIDGPVSQLQDDTRHLVTQRVNRLAAADVKKTMVSEERWQVSVQDQIPGAALRARPARSIQVRRRDKVRDVLVDNTEASTVIGARVCSFFEWSVPGSNR